jgi:hypothetical protein
MAESDDPGAVMTRMRAAMDDMHQAGRLRGGYGLAGAVIFSEALLARGGQGDLDEAELVIDRFADLAAEKRWAMLDTMLLRLRALAARGRGDEVAYRDLAENYRAMAQYFGYEGHLDWAEAMIEQP